MFRAGLTPGQRQLIHLHLDGEGPGSISRKTRIAESTLRHRLEGALSALRMLASEKRQTAAEERQVELWAAFEESVEAFEQATGVVSLSAVRTGRPEDKSSFRCSARPARGHAIRRR